MCVCVCVSEGDRGPMPPVQRGPYQRALSMDAKPMGGGEGGGLAVRRNVPCPTLIKQENMEAPIRSGPVPNGFPGGMAVCPPRGNPTSNVNSAVSLFTCVSVASLRSRLSSLPSTRSHGQRNGHGPTSSHVGAGRLGHAEVRRQPRAPTGTPRNGARWSHVWADGEPVH